MEKKININGFGEVAHIDFDDEVISFSNYNIKESVSELSFDTIKKLFVCITDLNNLTTAPKGV